MAYNYEYVCSECGKNCYGPRSSVICPECVEKTKTEELNTHLNELSALPIEERLARLELFMYRQRSARDRNSLPGVIFK